MSEPYRITIEGEALASLSFAEGEVVAYNSDRVWCKVSDADIQGIAGFAGAEIGPTASGQIYQIWCGMKDLLNDAVSPVLAGDKYSGQIYIMSDGLTVTRNVARGVRLLSMPPVGVSSTRVRVWIGSPGVH